jgi:enoyl-CoA hydratase/carnithine racemase
MNTSYMSSNMSLINYERDGAVGVATMAKPPHNLLDNALLAELTSAYSEAVEEGCRSILLRSSMRHFCAGADLEVISSEMIDQAGLERIWHALEDVPVPTVAAVHGAALGSGFEFALICDMVIAADTASIGMAEASLGLLPLLGGVQRVVQRAGAARAKEMAMFGHRNDPHALERWNIINLVTPESELSSVSLSWAKQLASGPTVALRGIKKVVNLAAREGIGGANAVQADVNESMWASADRNRGLAASAATGPGSAVFQGD